MTGRHSGRTLAAAAVLAAALTVVEAPARAETRRVEAESGSVDNAFCGDVAVNGIEPERMETSTGHDDTSVYVVFPGDACSLSFGELAGVRRVVAVRFVATGAGGVLCGRFVFSGGLYGSSRLLCTEERDWAVVPVHTTARTGPFTVTWRVDGGTPRWVNAYLDYLEVS